MKPVGILLKTTVNRVSSFFYSIQNHYRFSENRWESMQTVELYCEFVKVTGVMWEIDKIERITLEQWDFTKY